MTNYAIFKLEGNYLKTRKLNNLSDFFFNCEI